MKNVHLIPTEKLVKSKNDLVKDKYGDIHIFTKNDGKEYGKTTTKLNIYITSDEEIKEGDYYYLPRTNSVYKCIEDPTELNLERRLGVAKIILTTDPDLIAEGVQAIDDEFLEWFAKNPSCERVEVFHQLHKDEPLYKIIIPQEEPKQECTCESPTDNTCDYCEKENKIEILEEAKKRVLEKETLEEAAERLYPENWQSIMDGKHDSNSYERNAFIGGAKWQAERMYSEEDLKLILQLFVKDTRGNSPWVDADDEWFEQFKKKLCHSKQR